jgi:hypothetical protein
MPRKHARLRGFLRGLRILRLQLKNHMGIPHGADRQGTSGVGFRLVLLRLGCGDGADIPDPPLPADILLESNPLMVLQKSCIS